MPKTNIRPISDGQKFSVSCGASASSGRVKVKEYTWPAFKKKLSVPTRTPETVKEYRALSVQDKGATKDIGYFIGGASIDGARSAKSIPKIELLSLDADKAPRDWIEILNKTLPFEWAAYTTHSHSPSAPRVRIIIPIKRSVSQAEHAYIIRAVAAQVGESWFDPSGFRPTQPMFWPSIPIDGEYIFEEMTGSRVDPDSLLAENPNWMDRRTWPIAGKESDAIGARVGKAEDPTEKKGAVGAFCRAYDIRAAIDEFLPGTYEAGTDEDRLTYTEGSTVNGAVIYGEGLWLYSHHGSDPIHGRLVNAFDLVRIHKFGGRDEKTSTETPINRRPSFLAMSELCRDDPKTRIELHKERLSEAQKEFDDFGADPESWMQALSITDKGVIKATYLNCVLMLENDPVLKGCASENLFTGATDQKKALGDVEPEKNGQWGKKADGFIREYFERVYKVVFPASIIKDALEGYAIKNPYHPLRDWFGSLKWDGVKRAEKLFVKYLGVIDSKYSRSVCRKMLLAAYWRVMNPGCKFDFVVILEGAQGIQKSTFWRALSKGNLTELSTFDPKTAAEIITGKWFIEVAELDGFSRFDQRQLKSFFSKQEDRFREAYAVRAQSKGRQCVFVGSTNDEEYLQDRTGNRRYWPCKCNKTPDKPIDIEALEKEVDQVWAEVVEMAKEGEKLFLDAEDIRAAAEAEQRARLFSDEWEGQIGRWLDAPALIDRYQEGGEFSEQTETRDRVCLSEIWVECLKGDPLKLDYKARRRIGDCLRSLEWVPQSTRRFGKYGRQKAFIPDVSKVPF